MLLLYPAVIGFGFGYSHAQTQNQSQRFPKPKPKIPKAAYRLTSGLGLPIAEADLAEADLVTNLTLPKPIAEHKKSPWQQGLCVHTRIRIKTSIKK